MLVGIQGVAGVASMDFLALVFFVSGFVSLSIAAYLLLKTPARN